VAERPIHFYINEEIDPGTLDGHIQDYLDDGATVCVHYHEREEPCEDSCERREPEVERRNVFDQAK
jgi:hypothetical protein